MGTNDSDGRTKRLLKAVWASPRHGDLSKFKNLVWLGSFILVVLSAISYVVVWLLTPEEWNTRVLLSISGVLIIVSAVLLTWIWHLTRQRRDLLEKHDDATEHLALANYRTREYQKLLAACRSLDQQLMAAYGTGKSMEAAIDHALFACARSISSHVEFEKKRLAFLIYSADRDRFSVTSSLNMGYESHTHVETRLSKDQGLAGTAMQDPDRDMICLDDVLAPDAAQKGYIWTRETKPSGSICCKGVWVNDKFMGVLSIDCPCTGAFNADDKAVIELFADKIELILAVYLANQDSKNA